jgi:hypothetical protein
MGGQWRTHDVNIGVAYEQIAVDLRNSLGTILYRWENTDDWTPHELGVVAHAETVRIHPSETAVPQGFSQTYCSLPYKIPIRCSSMTGMSTKSATSTSFVGTTQTGTSRISRDCSKPDR